MTTLFHLIVFITLGRIPRVQLHRSFTTLPKYYDNVLKLKVIHGLLHTTVMHRRITTL